MRQPGNAAFGNGQDFDDVNLDDDLGDDLDDDLDDDLNDDSAVDEDDGQDWEALEEDNAALAGDLWAVQEVGTLTAELDQLDELAGRWLTGAGAGDGPVPLPGAGGVAEGEDGLDDEVELLSDEDDDLDEDDEEPQDLPVTRKYKLKYPDVYTWYEDWFRDRYRRRVDGRRRVWSGAWYDNPEASERMESMWRAWESLRQDPETGGSRWFLHHADEHMKVLMDPEGPFENFQNSEADFTSSTQPLAWRAPAKDDSSGRAGEL